VYGQNSRGDPVGLFHFYSVHKFPAGNDVRQIGKPTQFSPSVLCTMYWQLNEKATLRGLLNISNPRPIEAPDQATSTGGSKNPIFAEGSIQQGQFRDS